MSEIFLIGSDPDGLQNQHNQNSFKIDFDLIVAGNAEGVRVDFVAGISNLVLEDPVVASSADTLPVIWVSGGVT